MSILTIRLDTKTKTAVIRGDGVEMTLYEASATLRIKDRTIEQKDPDDCVEISYAVPTTERYFIVRGDTVEPDNVIEGDGCECEIPKAA